MRLQPVDYEAWGRAFTGYLADGSKGKAAPGILIAHEAGGLDTNVKMRAEMLAARGYVAFAMDLFGEEPGPLDRMRELTAALRENRPMLRDIMRAGLGVLTRHAHVDPARLAAIGYCFGGAAVLELARTGATLGCVVGFHSGLPTSTPEEARAIAGKVLICQGADDPVIGADQRDAFVAEMAEAGADWQLILYGGVGHSFTNRDIDAYGFPGFRYDATADRRSWRAMLDLFDETFGTLAS